MLLTKDKSKKETLGRLFAWNCALFTDQRTAFTHAQGAILQSQNFNLRVKRARKISYSRSEYSKTNPVTLPFNGEIFNSKSEMYVRSLGKIMEWNAKLN